MVKKVCHVNPSSGNHLRISFGPNLGNLAIFKNAKKKCFLSMCFSLIQLMYPSFLILVD